MIKSVLVLCSLILGHARLLGQQLDSCSVPNNPYFDQAYTEMASMLEGRDCVNLKRAVFLQEWAYHAGELDYKVYCAQIDSIAAGIKGFIAANQLDRSPIGGNIALFEFFAHPHSMNGYKPYCYDFDDFKGKLDYTNQFVTKLMRTHKGQCRSLPLLYKILANEIGATAYIAYAPNHSFIRHRDEQDTRWINVELTNISLPREVFIIETMGITPKAVELGTYLKPCEDREVIINLMVDLANTYLHKIGYIDPFVWKCLATVCRYNPQNLTGLMTAHICLYKIACQHRAMLLEKGMPDDKIMQDIGEQLIDINKKIDETGYKDMPKELYDNWVKSAEQEIERRKQEQK